MSILTGGGNTDSAGPVVVEVGQLVSQLLEVLRLEPAGVLHHVVAGRVDGALPHRLRHQEEVVPERRVVTNRAK